MPYEAQYMARYADVNSPLTRDSSGAFVRGGLPITPAMMQHLQERHGINLGGFPAAGVAGTGTGAPAGAGTAPAATAAGPGAVQWSTLDAPLTPAQAAVREFADNQKMQQDPAYQNALETGNAARNLITALQSKSVAGDRAALTLYARTFLANARASGAGEEQIKDYTSQYQQWLDGWEKMFEHGTTLPDKGNGSRQDLASRAAAFAANSKAVYDSKFGPGSPARSAYAASGLNPDRGIPTVEALRQYDPNTFQWQTPDVSGARPAGTIGQAPAAPPGKGGSRAPAADIQELLGR
jgi:hypothetical protein